MGVRRTGASTNTANTDTMAANHEMEGLGDVLTDTVLERGTKHVKYHRNCMECRVRFTGFIADAVWTSPTRFAYSFFCSAACADLFDRNMTEKRFQKYLNDDVNES